MRKRLLKNIFMVLFILAVIIGMYFTMLSARENLGPTSVTFNYYVVFAMESLVIGMLVVYLLVSKFNKHSFHETFFDGSIVLVYIITVAILTVNITISDGAVTRKYFLESSMRTTNVQDDCIRTKII